MLFQRLFCFSFFELLSSNCSGIISEVCPLSANPLFSELTNVRSSFFISTIFDFIRSSLVLSVSLIPTLMSLEFRACCCTFSIAFFSCFCLVFVRI